MAAQNLCQAQVYDSSMPSTCTLQVKDLARLSLQNPEYVAVHADAEAPTPLKLRQVTVSLCLRPCRVCRCAPHS